MLQPALCRSLLASCPGVAVLPAFVPTPPTHCTTPLLPSAPFTCPPLALPVLPPSACSGRDFTEADYEQLLALDQGNKKKVAPRDRVSQLDTVRVPLAGRGAEAACAGSPELDACSICLEEARPGDEFKVLPCRHAFHCRCIDRWLLSERNSCPVCQREAV